MVNVRLRSKASDIEDLITRGNYELADVICDAEIDRLLSVKRNIALLVHRPELAGDIGMGAKNGLNPLIVSDNGSVTGFELRSGSPGMGGGTRLMDQEGSMRTHVAVRRSDKREHCS